MCNKYSYNFHSTEDSLKILREDRKQYTFECCPEIPSIPERVEPLLSVVGHHPVVYNKMPGLIHKLEELSYETLNYDVHCEFKHLVQSITADEFFSNNIDKNKFLEQRDVIYKLVDRLIASGSLDESRRFEFIKKSSPKVSNVFASLLRHRIGEGYEKHSLIKDFNDRGTQILDDFEFILSVEPHRIAGMSAYGTFTSCQDWLQKDLENEYHSYTHAAWSNLNDPTVGIMFIRRKGDENQEDMLARALLRVLPLEKGQVVLYVHRMYGHAPYSQYLTSSIEAWGKTLPKNYHVIDMNNKYPANIEGKSSGRTHIGTTEWTFSVPSRLPVEGYDIDDCHECSGTGRITVECEECAGLGYTEDESSVTCADCGGAGIDDNEAQCWKCNGEGEIEETERLRCMCCSGRRTEKVDCDHCNGKGSIRGDSSDYYPYNDHDEWLDFGRNSITFQVPNYILRIINDEGMVPDEKTA